MKVKLGLSCAVTALLGVFSCGGGEQVALNERIFVAETMRPAGAGCSLFKLGTNGAEGTVSGEAGGLLGVKQYLDGNEVVVSVNEGDRTIVERRYGQSFFEAGTLDEFAATPSSGGSGLLLRYWGKFHPDGTASCTPLEQDKP